MIRLLRACLKLFLLILYSWLNLANLFQATKLLAETFCYIRVDHRSQEGIPLLIDRVYPIHTEL